MNKKHLCDRDKVLSRTFKMFVNASLYTEDEFHAFCRWAKGKSESMMMAEINR